MFGIKKAITCVALAMMSMAPIAAAEDMVAMLLPENVNPHVGRARTLLFL